MAPGMFFKTMDSSLDIFYVMLTTKESKKAFLFRLNYRPHPDAHRDDKK